MVLAQETAIMLLDEPTTWLDISHQIDLLELLSELNRERGIPWRRYCTTSTRPAATQRI